MTPPDAKREATAGLHAMMDRYIDGDARAFTQLHAMMAPRLRGFLLRTVHDESIVDDLVQLTLLKAHIARDRFSLQGGDPDGAVQGWYFAICRNVAMDFLRTRYRGAKRLPPQGTAAGGSTPAGDAIAELADESPNIDELREATEEDEAIVTRVRAAIARLPDSQREVVELHKLQGMSMAQISERLAVREGALRVRAHRAYKALAQLLAKGSIDLVFLLWFSSHAP